MYRKLIIGLAVLFVCAAQNDLFAQYKWNFGLTHRQEVLPKSNVPPQVSERKAKIEEPVVFVDAGDNQLILSSGWELSEVYKVIGQGGNLFDPAFDTKAWYNATVPGTVLTTLVNQGVYPDPYYGLNNVYISDTLCRMDWWYRVVFDTPQQAKGKRTHILLNGINYKAEVWLNAQLLGTMVGAFKRGYFDVTDVLKDEGENVLAIRILPPNNPGIPAEQMPGFMGPNGGVLCLDGPTFISSVGWDWMPGIKDRNIGLWQDVRLCYGGDVGVLDPQVITDLPLPDTTSANVTVKTQLKNYSDRAQNVILQGRIEDVIVSKSVALGPGESVQVVLSPEEFPQLAMKNPRLWWPNGYGPQNLYFLELDVLQNGIATDHKTVRFGIKEYSYELMVDAPQKENWRIEYSPTNVVDQGKPMFDYKHRRLYDNDTYKEVVIPALREGVSLANFKETEAQENPFFILKINGQPIFCKGGNWGMDDAMKRVSRERLEPYFRLHKEANCNMVRNWTGESTEEVFYELADEYGMLVWNDFSMSTGDYNLDPSDDYLFRDNVKDIIIRFRNHPSIAVWCPRNEGYAPDYLEDLIQEVIAQEDGTRHYHGNSRYTNLLPSGPWGYRPSIEFYDLAAGFDTELGMVSFSTAETVRKFIAPEDQWPLGDVYAHYNMHWEWKSWTGYIDRLEALGKEKSKNLDEFAARAQVINQVAHRDMFEAWNHKMWNNTSGILLWMTHPAWPGMFWQMYSYDYETHGSFFGCKKAWEPLHVQWNLNDNKVILVNTTLRSYPEVRVEYAVYSPLGKRLYVKKTTCDMKANALTDCFVQVYPEDCPEFSLVRLTLSDRKGNVLSQNDYWYHETDRDDLSPMRDLTPVRVDLRHLKTEKGQEGNFLVRAIVRNVGKCAAVSIKMNVRDASTDASILPVYASDGYFNLLPGESKEIVFDVPDGTLDLTQCKVTAEGLNVARTETSIR